MSKHTLGMKRLWSVAGVLAVILMVGLGIGVSWWQLSGGVAAEEVGARGQVARLDLTLAEVPLEEIDLGAKDLRYYGNTLAMAAGAEVLNFENVEVKGRGNATWGKPKKPYQLRLASKADLLGLGKARRWVLLANYFDQSNLRAEVGFALGRMLGVEYTYDGEFVELYVDENYRGLYYLTHAVEIGKAMVDLRDPLGVLVELDNVYYNEGEVRAQAESQDWLVLKDAVDDAHAEEGFADFVESFNALWRAADTGDWAVVEAVADTESLAQYYLMSEFAMNGDAYVTSWFWHKDGTDDVLHAGPGWDFDGAFGNKHWWGEEDLQRLSPEHLNVRRVEEADGGIEGMHFMSILMYKLIEMPEFRQLAGEIYRERLAGRAEELLGGLAKQAAAIAGAAERNAERWKFEDYTEEAEDLLEWVRVRYQFLDMMFDGREVEGVEILKEAEGGAPEGAEERTTEGMEPGEIKNGVMEGAELEEMKERMRTNADGQNADGRAESVV